MMTFTDLKYWIVLHLPKKLWALVPDETAIKAQFKKYTGRALNLEQPKTFNEKSNWLKLYDRNPLMPRCSDKYAVREFVEEKVGAHVLNELYGVFENADEIDFDALPKPCILKVTDGSGWYVILKNNDVIIKKKPGATIDQARKRLKKWMGKSQYLRRREWCYKDIKPRIICEKYMETESSSLADYKFHCFHGEPRFIQAIVDRSTDCKDAFYDENWNKTDHVRVYPHCERELHPPACLKDMLEIATALSSEFLFVRVDLYDFEGVTVFGELSFNPESGYGTFSPPHWEMEFGNLLKLPIESKDSQAVK